MASWRASGLTSTEFCKGRGYARSSLLWWSSRLRGKRSNKPKAGAIRLARVIRAPAATAPAAAVLIEVDGARIAVGRDVHVETLRAVFDALRARTGSVQ